MGAREVMDRATAAMIDGDLDAMAKCYAADATAVTPDAGVLHGREQIITQFRRFLDAFPDAAFEPAATHEAGNVAIDEGFFVGTHTGPLELPTGEQVPPTGRQVRMRSCDIATVDGGMIIDHHFYYDQSELLEQLGLLPDQPA
jgi:ketosteroid isomerase-like protein